MRKTFLVITACFLFFMSFAQTVSIGTGTEKGYSPYYPGDMYSYAQIIYLASEINATGLITSLSFYYIGNSLINSDKLKIYLGHTSKTGFTTGTADWVSPAGMSLAFDTILTGYAVPGWIIIPLATPFAYNGTDNLLV